MAWCRADGTIERVKIVELLMTEALERVAGRQRRPRRPRRHRGHLGDHDRRDPGRPRGSATAAGDHGRRAVAVDDHRHQHRAALGPFGHQAHRPPGQEPARLRAGRQRLAPGPADRTPRHLGGAGARRAAARDPGRAHAPRRLRDDRRQAAGGHAPGRRQDPRADGASDGRHPRGLPRRGHPADGAAQGPHGADGQPRHRLGADGVPRARPAASSGSAPSSSPRPAAPV